jgi:TM2 domain-containing membrane protein YozV
MKNRCKLNIEITLCVFFISINSISFSQNKPDCDLKFVNHLVNIGNFKEALFLLDSTDCSTDQLNDSVSYFRGWSLYSLMRLSASSENLIKVAPFSSFYLKSHFFAAYNYSHLGNFEEAIQVLKNIDVTTQKQTFLKNYEIAGVQLLKGDTAGYEELIKHTDLSYYEISESAIVLQKMSESIKNHKSKSPFAAAILSGIIPGSGKFYAGKKGQAISAFISTAGLGVVSLENYRKRGRKSFSTIAFGTAFAFSYVANIWGSVLSVNILETEYRDNVKNTILFNLHIPLRNFFDK